MTIIERVFRLHTIPPFDRLTETELAIIAEVAVERKYESGKRLISRDKPARALFVAIQGSLTDTEGRRLPDVLSPASLLNGTPFPWDVIASPTEGCVCLLINKGHFFTILHECPALAIGFIDMLNHHPNTSKRSDFAS